MHKISIDSQQFSVWITNRNEDIDNVELSVLPGAHVGELPTVLFELSDQTG